MKWIRRGALPLALTLLLAALCLAAPAAAQAPGADAPARDPVGEALRPVPGGLTPDAAAAAATRTSATVRGKRAELEQAAAKVDQALVSYFPRLTVTATYTRLSPNSTPTSRGVFVSADGPLLTGPCPGVPAATCVLDTAGKPVIAASGSPLLNAFSVVATLDVPISDYVLRLTQTYASASRAQRAKTIEARAAELQVGADAKVAFFAWVRARGQVVVAKEAVAQAKAHADDARRTIDLGVVSKADVLRLEAQVASAQQLQAEAEALAAVAESQLRTLVHRPAAAAIEIGIDVMNEPAGAPPEGLPSLQELALRRRLEMRALDETQASLREAHSAVKAAYLPRVDAFADANFPNPNSRLFGVLQNELTWDVGVRASWTINDTFATVGASNEARARVSAVTEQKSALADAIRLEVASAYYDLSKTTASIEASERGLISAEESLRVRRELFQAGKARTVELIDAETELIRAHLARLDARIGRLVAKTRLAHATGQDVPAAPH